jgi:putative oxidoreductase
MKPVRSAAHAMLASIFIAGGIRVLLDPDSRADAAKTVTDRVGPMIEKIHPRLPSDTRSLTQIKAGLDVAAGLLLATGRLTRPAATVLAINLIPTTIAGHPFWGKSKPERIQHETQFLKNLGLMAGLLLTIVDTQGKPGLSYRTTHAVDRSQRRVKRAVKTARREAKIAAISAAAARRLPAK